MLSRRLILIEQDFKFQMAQHQEYIESLALGSRPTTEDDVEVAGCISSNARQPVNDFSTYFTPKQFRSDISLPNPFDD